MNAQSKWKANVERINASPITPVLGLAICSLVDGFISDREEKIDQPFVSMPEVLIIRLLRHDTTPEWLTALLDLLYESDLNYETVKLAHAALLRHWLARAMHDGLNFTAAE